MNHAESEAQSMGGTQRSASECPSNQDRPQTANGESTSSGNVIQRTTGNASQEPFIAGFLFGGIISQLIQDAEDRLAEANECITWYQREANKCEERLKQLRALSATLNQADSE